MTPAQGSVSAAAAGDATSGEHAALSRVRLVSTLLDDAIRVPGTNRSVGLDPILGILPVVGDAVASLFSLYVILESYRAGAPRRLLAKMVSLAAVDFVVGSIPVVGPVFDALWTANAWNVRLLETHLEE